MQCVRPIYQIYFLPLSLAFGLQVSKRERGGFLDGGKRERSCTGILACAPKYNMYHNVCACFVRVCDSDRNKRVYSVEVEREEERVEGYTGKPLALLESVRQARDGKWPRCGRRVELLQAARHF